MNRREFPQQTRAGTESQPRSRNEGLEMTVAALREEIRGLKAAAQLRAVIEQAKGVLIERHGYSLDEAFGHLRGLSQEHNVRLVEVAATVVGVALPPAELTAGDTELVRTYLPPSKAASPAWQAVRSEPSVRAGVAAALVGSLAQAVGEGDNGAQLLADLLSKEGVVAVSMYRAAADGSLQMVGQVGIPGDLANAWQRIPPSLDIPYVRTFIDGIPLFWGDRDQRLAQFPAATAVKSGFGAAAAIPVTDATDRLGVVGLMWAGDEKFDEARQQAIVTIVGRAAPLLLRHVTAPDPELDWLNTLLRLNLHPWIMFEAIQGSDLVVQDFVIQDASELVGNGHHWLGRRVLEAWPFLREDGTFVALTGLMNSGGSWTTTMAFASESPWGERGTEVRAVRLGQRVVLVWRPATR